MKNRTAYIWVYGAVLISALCLLFIKPLFDSDPLWSIEIGKYIIEHGIPNVDPFSWTVYGKAWITHEWLFCVLLNWLNGVFGDYGYVIYIALSLVVLGYVTYILAKAEKATMFGYLMAAGVLLVLYASGYMQSRAYLFSFSFLMLLIYFVRTNKYWYIPLLFVLWGNWHSSIIMGLVVLGTEAVYRLYRTRKWDLFKISVLSVLAGLLNPYGWKIYWYAIKVMIAPESKYISEWRPPNLDDYTTLSIYLGLAGFILLAHYMFIKQGHSHDDNGLMAGFWFWVFFIYALTCVRGLTFAILFYIPYMLYLTKHLITSQYKKAPVYIAATLFLMVGVYAYIAGYNWPPYNSDSWPNQAIAYMQENPQYQKNVFNDYLWGAPLIREGIKPFVDARCDVYMENGVLKDFMNTSNLSESPEKVFKKYDVKTIFIGKDTPLDIYLDGRKGWTRVYQDRVATIYYREGK